MPLRAVFGNVVGGIIALAIIVFVILILWRRRRLSLSQFKRSHPRGEFDESLPKTQLDGNWTAVRVARSGAVIIEPYVHVERTMPPCRNDLVTGIAGVNSETTLLCEGSNPTRAHSEFVSMTQSSQF